MKTQLCKVKLINRSIFFYHKFYLHTMLAAPISIDSITCKIPIQGNTVSYVVE